MKKMTTELKLKFTLLIGIFFIFFSCSSSDDDASYWGKDILVFDVENADVKIEGNTILVNFSSQQSDFNLAPEITVSEGAKVFPGSGTKVNFRNENVTFTVTAKDGTEKIYRVKMTQSDGLQAVKLCFFNANTSELIPFPGTIDEENKTITIKVTKSLFSNSRYTPYVETSTVGKDKYKATPSAEDVISENWDTYDLINETKQVSASYRVILLNTEAAIESINFPIEGYGIKYNLVANCYPKYTQGLRNTDYIVFTFDGQSLTSVIPTMTYSQGATISPAIDVAQDFTKDVQFSITPESGDSPSLYTIRVVKKKLIISNDHDNRSYGIISGGQSIIRYNAISPIKGGSLFDVQTGEEIKIATAVNKPARIGYTLTATYSKSLLSGTYRLRVTLENGDVVDADMLFKEP